MVSFNFIFFFIFGTAAIRLISFFAHTSKLRNFNVVFRKPRQHLPLAGDLNQPVCPHVPNCIGTAESDRAQEQRSTELFVRCHSYVTRRPGFRAGGR